MCTPENAICTFFSAAANASPERLRAICPDGLSFLLMKTCGLRLNNAVIITTTITPAGKAAAVFFKMYTPKKGVKKECTNKIKKEKPKENCEKYTIEALKTREKIY